MFQNKNKIWPLHLKSKKAFLWKIVDLLLPSTTDILDFIVSLSTLPALNIFLQDDSMMMKIKGDFNTTKKLSKNHFLLISVILQRIKSIKQFIEFLWKTVTFAYSEYLKSVDIINYIISKIHLKTNNRQS